MQVTFFQYVLLCIVPSALCIVLAIVIFYQRRSTKKEEKRHVRYTRPSRAEIDYDKYVCPVCGDPGTTFMRCQYPGCADGR